MSTEDGKKKNVLFTPEAHAMLTAAKKPKYGRMETFSETVIRLIKENEKLGAKKK